MSLRTGISAAIVALLLTTANTLGGISSHGFANLVETNGKPGPSCHTSPGARQLPIGLELSGGGRGWVESDEIIPGLAYRPSCSVEMSIRLGSDRDPATAGLVAEYQFSTDRVHWTDWRKFTNKTLTTHHPPPTFVTYVTVEPKDCESFNEAAERLGKPREGEVHGIDAYFRWLAERDPKIFSKGIPVVGYLRVRLRNEGNDPILILQATADYSSYTSGLASSGEPFDFTTKWRFDIREYDSPASAPAARAAAQSAPPTASQNAPIAPSRPVTSP